VTPAFRAVALRLASVGGPVGLVCFGALATLRLLGVLYGPTLWDEAVIALTLGAGSSLVHAAAIRVGRARPESDAALLVVGLPPAMALVAALAIAQVAYGAGVVDGGVEAGLGNLTAVGRDAAKVSALSLGILLGAGVGLAVPLGLDAWARLRDPRPSVSFALAVTFGSSVAALSIGALAHALFNSAVPNTWAHKFVLSSLAMAGVLALFLGSPLVILLAWAARLEGRLQAVPQAD
jgi:hypothetical protein